MRYTGLIVMIAFLISCQRDKNVEQPVAQVFESCLYLSEISDFIPAGISREDSIIMAGNYIKNWVTQKLLLHKAIENLSGEEAQIQKQVEDYRSSLLIHRYKQKMVEQHLMENIDETEIENYYQEHKNNFVLVSPIVKSVFFILPKNAPNLKKVKKWFDSDKEEDQESLEDYCLTHARKYDKFKNNWIEVKYLLNLVPGDSNNLEQAILTRNNIEIEDDDSYYFLKINDLRIEQTVAPIEYVKDEIIMILKNKKKLQFENELEKQINQEGRRKKYVKIY